VPAPRAEKIVLYDGAAQQGAEAVEAEPFMSMMKRRASGRDRGECLDGGIEGYQH